ncbi:hypothetical protein Tco_0333729, partial [Tanacetum coccineum]
MKGFLKKISESGRTFKVGTIVVRATTRITHANQNNQKQGNERAMTTTSNKGKVKQEEVEEARGRAYAIKDAEPQGPNVVT